VDYHRLPWKCLGALIFMTWWWYENRSNLRMYSKPCTKLSSGFLIGLASSFISLYPIFTVYYLVYQDKGVLTKLLQQVPWDQKSLALAGRWSRWSRRGSAGRKLMRIWSGRWRCCRRSTSSAWTWLGRAWPGRRWRERCRDRTWPWLRSRRRSWSEEGSTWWCLKPKEKNVGLSP